MIDWSNMMNVGGNKDRSFAAPGASAISSIFNPPSAGGSPNSGALGALSKSPALGIAPLNIMPQDQGQQPGQMGLMNILKLLQGAFGAGGVMGGGSMAGGAGASAFAPQAMPPASPMASAMLAKRDPLKGGLL